MIPNVPAKFIGILVFSIRENVTRVCVWNLCCVHCALFKTERDEFM
jgi:hypothetical protein